MGTIPGITRGLWAAAILLALPSAHGAEATPDLRQTSSPPSRVVVTVYGAAGEVAGSMSVLDTGNARWMIDCGALAPERESEKDQHTGGMLSRREASGEPGDRDGSAHADPLLRSVTACHPTEQHSAALPIDGRSIAAVFLTHAHSDHVGRIPLLVESGFRGPLYMTDATAELLPLMLRMQILYDEGRSREWSWSKQAYARARSGERPVTAHWHAGCPYRTAISRENHQSARLSFAQLAARFQQQDRAVEVSRCRRCADVEVGAIVAQCRRVAYGKPMEIVPRVSVTFLDAGHIPGSASVLFDVRVGEKKRRVLFSGDVGNDLSPLFPGPRPAPDVDAVFIETTYGPTFRDPSVDAERAQFRRMLGEIVARGGVAWIPAFALDRTQKILYELRLAQQEGQLSRRVPIFCTSATAQEITAIYRQHRQDGWFRDSVSADPSAWSPDGLRRSTGLPETLPQPSVLLTTSGMLDRGLSRRLASRLLPEKSTAVFLVGYQDPASPGGMLMKATGLLREGTRDQASGRPAGAGVEQPTATPAPRLDLDGRLIPVHAAVQYFRCFSAHGDAKDLDAWLSGVHRTAKGVLVHGGAWELAARAEQLGKHGWRDVMIAKPGVPIDMTGAE